MARRPNYAQDRRERDRAKQAKREAKLRERQEAAEQRKLAAQTTDVEDPADAAKESPE